MPCYTGFQLSIDFIPKCLILFCMARVNIDYPFAKLMTLKLLIARKLNVF